MVELQIQATTKEYGCMVYTSITVMRNYTMNDVIDEVRRRGFSSFRLLETNGRFLTV